MAAIRSYNRQTLVDRTDDKAAVLMPASSAFPLTTLAFGFLLLLALLSSV